MKSAISVEALKLRRSPVVVTTSILLIIVVPLLCRAFVAAATSGYGVTGAKAQAMIVGEGWEAYFGLLGQMIAVTMFIGPGVVAAWVFGREHADRTFGSLFALPVSRGSIAMAKFVVLFAWGTALSVLLLCSSVLVGLGTNVGSMGDVDALAYIGRLSVAALATMMLALTVGYVASVGRGYLPAVGALIIVTAAAQISVFFGAGGWFPYAVPGIYAVAATGQIDDVSWIQFLLVPLTVGVIVHLTVRWWSRTEVA